LNTLLLDAGVWVGAVDSSDPFHDSARSLVFAFDQPVAAMDLTLYEVANVLGVRKEWRREARYLSELIVRRCSGRRFVRPEPSSMDLAISIAGERGLSAYDAAYVAAAHVNGWTLVSVDIADLVSKGLAVTPDAALYP
jgi:predicted nucleic acid-binding protein